jgi:hypothetical protein
MPEVTIHRAPGLTEEQIDHIDHIDHILETMAESFAQQLRSPTEQEKR